MPRSYYLAVEPPPVDRARLSLVMRRLGSLSPLPHITVVEPPRLSAELAWWDAAMKVGSASVPILVEPDGVRTFDDRVMYLAVYAPSLIDLRSRLLEAISPERGGSSPGDEQPFVPHLTLATARRGRPLPELHTIQPLVAHLEPFVAVELTLYRRDIAAHGYRAWRRIVLGAT